MIEALCKVLEAIIDTRIKTVVVLHDALYVFFTRRGTGAAMMEIKIAQDIASINQDSLFLVFLDICKAYETLERRQLIQALEGYGEFLNMWILLTEFCENQEVVTRQNGYHGHWFRETYGTI